MTFEETGEPTLADALTLMVTGYQQLLKLFGAGADGFDATGAVEFMQAFEQFRSQLSVVDHHLIAVAQQTGEVSAGKVDIIQRALDKVDRRGFDPDDKDGAYVGDFRLTGTAGAKLKTLLDPLAKPRIDPTGGCRSAQLWAAAA